MLRSLIAALTLGAFMALGVATNGFTQVPTGLPFPVAMTSGNCVKATGSFQAGDAGAACGTGTVNSGTANHFAYYASSTAAISSNANLVVPTTAGTVGQTLLSGGNGSTAMTWGRIPLAWAGVSTGAITGAVNTSYCVDTTGGVSTLTLPSSPNDGDQIEFIDCKSNFATNNLTVARNGNTIMGSASNMTVSTNNAASTLVYVLANTDWRLH